MKTISDLTGKEYYQHEAVFYRNPVQSAFMWKNGARLIDLLVDGGDKFVYVWSRKDHERILPLWIEKGKNYKKEYNTDESK